MPEDEKSSSANGERVILPNFAELWKELYFKTETAWADAFKEYVGTENFMLLLNKSLEQYLSMEKVTRNNIDKYFETSPLPSKKDIARIAEMVIAVEDKVDNFNGQFTENLRSMADSLLRMSIVLGENKQEIVTLQQEIVRLNKKVDTLSKKAGINSKETRPRQKKTETKETGG
jgi:polyhydroxyalkanoic acid synthase PhaR subunit